MKYSIILLLCMLLCNVYAMIPSFGLQSMQGIRGTLSDSAFIIKFKEGKVKQTSSFMTLSADMTRFPVLAGRDVQTKLTQVFVNPGQSFTRHYHPRSSEIIVITKGVFGVEIVYEGANPRIVRVDVKEGEATVFPQGLIHQVHCKVGFVCSYYAVFTSADPGTVVVPRG